MLSGGAGLHPGSVPAAPGGAAAAAASPACPPILSLGAGFDSLYFRLKDMGLLHHTMIYEVDFPNVAQQKAALIKRTEELSALVGSSEGEGLVPHGAVGVAGSVPAVRAMHSDTSGLRRYGHCSVLLKRDVILTTGGFGEEDGQHCRMRNFHVLIKHAGCWKAGCVKKEKSWDERLYHTVSCVSSSLALVVGGRASPSSAGLGMLWLKFPETCNALDPGKKYLFVYGGRSALEPVLGDWISCMLKSFPALG
ncbi:hypothetical protein AAES_18296 [Amazona aestiva]|uniref:[Phosphatase 2A protein]-leucine-carboxy methyltransferase 1 n=1 Tax=Amazona aestiva TaxID=12930 RepID=A0A0Q3X856_AMAAE|nr:hypothetical protein AAES_18296 [Amazona aestiva]